MIPLQNYNRVVLAAVENRVLNDVTVIVRAGVQNAAAAAAAAAAVAEA